MTREQKALENIKREAGIPYFTTLYDIDMWREDLQTLKKGLEILEILNKYLKWDVYTASYTTSMNSKPKNYLHIDFMIKEISDEEKELLMEYLKNDK